MPDSADQLADVADPVGERAQPPQGERRRPGVPREVPREEGIALVGTLPFRLLVGGEVLHQPSDHAHQPAQTDEHADESEDVEHFPGDDRKHPQAEGDDDDGHQRPHPPAIALPERGAFRRRFGHVVEVVVADVAPVVLFGAASLITIEVRLETVRTPRIVTHFSSLKLSIESVPIWLAQM